MDLAVDLMDWRSRVAVRAVQQVQCVKRLHQHEIYKSVATFNPNYNPHSVIEGDCLHV